MRSMARASLLDVIEAAYDLEAPIDVWHGEIVAQACRAFPGAIGALGYRYRLEASLPVLTSAVLGDREFAGVPDQGHHSVDGEHLYRAYTLASHAEPTTIFHADPMTGKPPPVLCQMWKRLGVSDMFGVYATRRDGDSMTVGIAMPPRRGDDVRASDWRPLSRQWSCLARHLEIALAVREAVEQDGLAADFDLSSGDFRGGAVADRDLLLATARAVERERTAIGTGDSVSLGVWDQLLLSLIHI